MSKVNFQDGGVFDFNKPHAPVSISDWEPSLARQEFQDECDINQIMMRFEKGEAPSFTPRVPLYLDLTEMPDTLQGTLNLLNEAAASFNSLPALVRREFENDPVLFVEFASDPANLEQLRTWGLAPPKPVEPAPQRVELVNPPAPPAPPKPPQGG